MSETRKIEVDYLARVEGEGAIKIHMKGEEVEKLEVRIFEPPRFFEGFLRGRPREDVPDVTARICGICPVAYLTSGCLAVEMAAGVELTPELNDLRRLLYVGEYIESHVLHMFMLHLPDFLGYQDAIRMAADFPDQVKLALKAKKTGNDIMAAIGGREIHPINSRVGGFYRAPRKADLRALLPRLEECKAGIEAANRFMAENLEFPELTRDFDFVSVTHPDEYAIQRGDVMSSRSGVIPVEEYEEHFEEIHVERSNALHSVHRGFGNYHVGPLARFANNFDKLSEAAKAHAEELGVEAGESNPFRSLLVRGVEVFYAFEEAIRLIEKYQEPDPVAVELPLVAGWGCGVSEAPRGLLYHRYEVDQAGKLLSAKITPPTAQNFATMEDDLRDLAPQLARMELVDATWRAEQCVRNYDPCISCATHFLKLSIVQVEE